jgi:hypothetical protein
MEDAPTIRIISRRLQPEYDEKYHQWLLGAYYPLLINVPGFEQIAHYRIVKENPQYNRQLGIFHYKNREDQLKPRSDQRLIDVQKDAETTFGGRYELLWFVAYQQIANYKRDTPKTATNEMPEVEDSPVIHLEGYYFSNPEQERYDTWFSKWGQEVFIPLMIRLPGLKEYIRYKLIDPGLTGLLDFNHSKRPIEYPTCLSIITFENIKAFENYESSLELAAFKSAVQAPFPLGLNYQWYVQYQLVKSWRKQDGSYKQSNSAG